MSDGMSDLYRSMRNSESYENRIQFIKTASLNDLCRFYKIDIEDDLLSIGSQYKEFQIEFKYCYFNQANLWTLTFLIPSAHRWTESFTSKDKNEVATKALAYLKWSQTDLDRNAISIYLDK